MVPGSTPGHSTTASNDNGQFPVRRDRAGLSRSRTIHEAFANSDLISLTYVADRVFIITGAHDRVGKDAALGDALRSA
jgi:hypothetical protein